METETWRWRGRTQEKEELSDGRLTMVKRGVADGGIVQSNCVDRDLVIVETN